MKIPLSKDENDRGIIMFGAQAGRKELIHDLRETALISENAIQRRDMVDAAVQFGVNMDLGSGDAKNYIFGIKDDYDSFGDGFQSNFHVQRTNETSNINSHITKTSSRSPSPLTPDKISTTSSPPSSSSSSSSESLNNTESNAKSDNLFRGKKNNPIDTKESQMLFDEQDKESGFQPKQPSPEVPTLKKKSQITSQKPSDNSPSESEDRTADTMNAKRDEPTTRSKEIRNTIAKVEDSKNSEKVDKNGNWSDADKHDGDNGCIVQCLCYTIQCYATPSSTPPVDITSSSLESLNKKDFGEKSKSDQLFKMKQNKSTETNDSLSIAIEDGKRTNFRANESNPTVPSLKEPSETSTLRLSERPRSESEDDIEKMDDPEQDGTIIMYKALYKTKAATDDSQNSEKIDKNGNWSDAEQTDIDNDCIVQCLYYTIQCCECVTF